MSLAALAVVNRQATPLYMRDYTASNNNDACSSYDDNNNNLLFFNLHGQLRDDDGDIFGDDELIEETTTEQRKEWPCQLKYQFVLHSACERLEEVLMGNRWKAPGASGMDANWVGLLCLSDNLRAYGYVTTNARYVTLVEDSIAPENAQLQKSRDNEMCLLMANAHRLYTETLLNPFTSLHSKITSKRFESGVTTLVHRFNGR